MVKVEPSKRARTPTRARRSAAPHARVARPDGAPIGEVWARYRASHSEALRNALIEHYYHLVRYHAERLHARLPRHVNVDELCSHGLMGLIDAIDAFDPDRNTKFETFAPRRITGAILDELRSFDWVPRGARARAAKVEGVRTRFHMENGRLPTEDEILQRLREQGSRADLVYKDREVTSMRPFAQGQRRTEDGREYREIDTVQDAQQTGPLRAAQSKDLRDSFIRSLNRAERLIVILYHQEEMTMREIGQTLRLSESRVSQLHASIMTRLRDLARRRSEECSG